MLIYLFVIKILFPVIYLLFLSNAVTKLFNAGVYARQLRDIVKVEFPLKYYEALLLILGLPVLISPIIFIIRNKNKVDLNIKTFHKNKRKNIIYLLYIMYLIYSIVYFFITNLSYNYNINIKSLSMFIIILTLFLLIIFLILQIYFNFDIIFSLAIVILILVPINLYLWEHYFQKKEKRIKEDSYK